MEQEKDQKKISDETGIYLEWSKIMDIHYTVGKSLEEIL